MKAHQFIKVILGIVIFLFGTALAYFTANYLDHQKIFDYWSTLAIFAGGYAAIGIVVASIFPISLGFLFGADTLLLNILYENYGKFPNIYKTILLGFILLVLYVTAYLKTKDAPTSFPPPAQMPTA